MAQMQSSRRTFIAGMASLTLYPAPLDFARAQQLERTSLKLGVANKAHLYYLPVTIAERRGHFRDYGLSVTMSDFEGGGQALILSRRLRRCRSRRIRAHIAGASYGKGRPRHH